MGLEKPAVNDHVCRSGTGTFQKNRSGNAVVLASWINTGDNIF